MVCDKVRCEVRLVYKNSPPPRNGGEITTNTIFTNIFKQSRFAEKRASIVFYIVFAPIPGGSQPL